jgi:hypothetical protein
MRISKNHLKIPLPEDTPPANRTVNLPPFWTTNPQSWFTSAEGAFRLCNIADELPWYNELDFFSK